MKSKFYTLTHKTIYKFKKKIGNIIYFSIIFCKKLKKFIKLPNLDMDF